MSSRAPPSLAAHFYIEYSRRNQAGELSECRSSPPPMGAETPKKSSACCPAFWEGIERLTINHLQCSLFLPAAVPPTAARRSHFRIVGDERNNSSVRNKLIELIRSTTLGRYRRGPGRRPHARADPSSAFNFPDRRLKNLKL
ncbi:hypothetical protein EVAR_31347_1 [Eumeta japonica]|uniref:Uncharacterized protein n=1 Tax=Eumeta variegata TaxID=151549 RepID=A0A4C1XXN9_EUMVA|nr:hypothetical protein EVAR_31347_1 [Eumeta japonica]